MKQIIFAVLLIIYAVTLITLGLIVLFQGFNMGAWVCLFVSTILTIPLYKDYAAGRKEMKFYTALYRALTKNK